MKKGRWLLIAIPAVLIIIALIIAQLMWKYTDNTGLVMTTYQVSSPRIPQEFHGFRIAQVADLHNTEFGEKNSELLSILRESKPDIIVFTGDQVDVRETRAEVTVDFVREAVQIAPCYLVTGNHEGGIVEIEQLKTDLEAAGGIWLENNVIELQHDGAELTLMGLADPTMDSRFFKLGLEGSVDDTLANLNWDRESYCILLAHHPEFLEVYSKYGIDLTLCGHAHGGQIRIGETGIIAPHQGLFPKYDAGRYDIGSTTMILSRGLGNSRFPWRVNNPPELVLVELTSEQ